MARNRSSLEQPTHRFVPPGGFSRTLAGILKIAVGLILKTTGWVLSLSDKEELISGLAMLIGLGLDFWGMGQIYHARQSRGDLNAVGQRVSAVEVIVAPDPPPPVDEPIVHDDLHRRPPW